MSLYKEAYDVAKAASPKTKVFPTFQLEDLEGTFGTVHPPHWEVIDPFRGKMDALAISTYPFLAQVRTRRPICARDYYSQLKQHWNGEILIAETGWASAPVEGQVNVGTEEDQQAYLVRLLDDASANGFSLVVWFAALDPAFAQSGRRLGVQGHRPAAQRRRQQARVGHVGRLGAAAAQVVASHRTEA